MQIRKREVTESCGFPSNILKYNMQIRKYEITESCGVS